MAPKSRSTKERPKRAVSSRSKKNEILCLSESPRSSPEGVSFPWAEPAAEITENGSDNETAGLLDDSYKYPERSPLPKSRTKKQKASETPVSFSFDEQEATVVRHKKCKKKMNVTQSQDRHQTGSLADYDKTSYIEYDSAFLTSLETLTEPLRSVDVVSFSQDLDYLEVILSDINSLLHNRQEKDCRAYTILRQLDFLSSWCTSLIDLSDNFFPIQTKLLLCVSFLNVLRLRIDLPSSYTGDDEKNGSSSTSISPCLSVCLVNCLEYFLEQKSALFAVDSNAENSVAGYEDITTKAGQQRLTWRRCFEFIDALHMSNFVGYLLQLKTENGGFSEGRFLQWQELCIQIVEVLDEFTKSKMVDSFKSKFFIDCRLYIPKMVSLVTEGFAGVLKCATFSPLIQDSVLRLLFASLSTLDPDKATTDSPLLVITSHVLTNLQYERRANDIVAEAITGPKINQRKFIFPNTTSGRRSVGSISMNTHFTSKRPEWDTSTQKIFTVVKNIMLGAPNAIERVLHLITNSFDDPEAASDSFELALSLCIREDEKLPKQFIENVKARLVSVFNLSTSPTAVATMLKALENCSALLANDDVEQNDFLQYFMKHVLILISESSDINLRARAFHFLARSKTLLQLMYLEGTVSSVCDLSRTRLGNGRNVGVLLQSSAVCAAKVYLKYGITLWNQHIKESSLYAAFLLHNDNKPRRNSVDRVDKISDNPANIIMALSPSEYKVLAVPGLLFSLYGKALDLKQVDTSNIAVLEHAISMCLGECSYDAESDTDIDGLSYQPNQHDVEGDLPAPFLGALLSLFLQEKKHDEFITEDTLALCRTVCLYFTIRTLSQFFFELALASKTSNIESTTQKAKNSKTQNYGFRLSVDLLLDDQTDETDFVFPGRERGPETNLAKTTTHSKNGTPQLLREPTLLLEGKGLFPLNFSSQQHMSDGENGDVLHLSNFFKQLAGNDPGACSSLAQLLDRDVLINRVNKNTDCLDTIFTHFESNLSGDITEFYQYINSQPLSVDFCDNGDVIPLLRRIIPMKLVSENSLFKFIRFLAKGAKNTSSEYRLSQTKNHKDHISNNKTVSISLGRLASMANLLMDLVLFPHFIFSLILVTTRKQVPTNNNLLVGYCVETLDLLINIGDDYLINLSENMNTSKNYRDISPIENQLCSKLKLINDVCVVLSIKRKEGDIEMFKRTALNKITRLLVSVTQNSTIDHKKLLFLAIQGLLTLESIRPQALQQLFASSIQALLNSRDGNEIILHLQSLEITFRNLIANITSFPPDKKTANQQFVASGKILKEVFLSVVGLFSKKPNNEGNLVDRLIVEENQTSMIINIIRCAFRLLSSLNIFLCSVEQGRIAENEANPSCNDENNEHHFSSKIVFKYLADALYTHPFDCQVKETNCAMDHERLSEDRPRISKQAQDIYILQRTAQEFSAQWINLVHSSTVIDLSPTSLNSEIISLFGHEETDNRNISTSSLNQSRKINPDKTESITTNANTQESYGVAVAAMRALVVLWKRDFGLTDRDGLHALASTLLLPLIEQLTKNDKEAMFSILLNLLVYRGENGRSTSTDGVSKRRSNASSLDGENQENPAHTTSAVVQMLEKRQKFLYYLPTLLAAWTLFDEVQPKAYKAVQYVVLEISRANETADEKAAIFLDNDADGIIEDPAMNRVTEIFRCSTHLISNCTELFTHNGLFIFSLLMPTYGTLFRVLRSKQKKLVKTLFEQCGFSNPPNHMVLKNDSEKAHFTREYAIRSITKFIVSMYFQDERKRERKHQIAEQNKDAPIVSGQDKENTSDISQGKRNAGSQKNEKITVKRTSISRRNSKDSADKTSHNCLVSYDTRKNLRETRNISTDQREKMVCPISEVEGEDGGIDNIVLLSSTNA